MIGKLVKQKIFGELFGEPEGEVPYRYGLVLHEAEGYLFGSDIYYMVLWQPSSFFPVTDPEARGQSYSCVAAKSSLTIVS